MKTLLVKNISLESKYRRIRWFEGAVREHYRVAEYPLEERRLIERNYRRAKQDLRELIKYLHDNETTA